MWRFGATIPLMYFENAKKSDDCERAATLFQLLLMSCGCFTSHREGKGFHASLGRVTPTEVWSKLSKDTRLPRMLLLDGRLKEAVA